MFEGVTDSNIFLPQYWEFLEYEQILQVTNAKNTARSFNARLVDGVLYLENINDSSTAIIQYNKNQ